MVKIGVVGNGNWGTAVGKMLAENARKHTDIEDTVVMWTYEETVDGRNLSELINTDHINTKYLPGVPLPDNLVARTGPAMDDCDVVVFCLPHQFLDKLKNLRYKDSYIGVSLTKGLLVEDGRLYAPSQYIGRILGIECNSLTGANIASEVAQEMLSETTIGYVREEDGRLLQRIFESEYFKPVTVEYSPGLEICGALKNVMSVAYGIGIGQGYGSNTLSMLFRRCLVELCNLCDVLGQSVGGAVLSSACLGDLFASCLGGRNFKYGRSLGEKGTSVEEYEREIHGQKLQGPGTARAVIEWMAATGRKTGEFPITNAVYEFCFRNRSPDTLLDILKSLSSAKE